MYYYFYKITNNINGKYYYGVHSTTNINDGYMGSGKRLWNAYNKYGQSNFTKTIMRYFIGKEDMYAYEKQIVNKDLVKDPMCYNIAIGGLGGDIWKGLTPEDDKKLREKLSKALKGIPRTPEWIQHMSESQIGRKLSDEHRRKLSEIAKLKTGEKNNFYGHHHSEEQKKKWSENKKGIPSPNKGKPMTEEQKEKLRGRKRTAEQRKKISEATKKAMQDPKVRAKCAHKGENNPLYGKHWKLVNGKRLYY